MIFVISFSSADLEPYERKKMCSLPKSFTPFSSTVRDGGLECDKNLNRSASNSILLRKCESLSPTPSQFLLNGGEPNNNNITHPSSLSQMLLLHKSHEGFQVTTSYIFYCCYDLWVKNIVCANGTIIFYLYYRRMRKKTG